MDNKWLIIGIVALLLASCVAAITKISVQETDLVSLKPEAVDPDADNLVYNFSMPLNADGKWQTDYGDAGEYTVTVTVSDGEASSSEKVLLTVKRKEIGPGIVAFAPENTSLSINEHQDIEFSIAAEDKNKDILTYTWRLNGKKEGEESRYAFKTGYDGAGEYNIEIFVSDGKNIAMQGWSVAVENVDVEGIVEGIEDVTVKEGEIASLTMPDLGALGLKYSISGALDGNNSWQTGFDDAGEYQAEVSVFDGDGFAAKQKVDIAVENVNRKPIFNQIKGVWMDETQTVTIDLQASDPDGDEIEFSAENLPEGSTFRNNVFNWTTDYEAVNRDTFWRNVLDKFHFLYKSYDIQFYADDGTDAAEQDALIRVKDINRAPVLKEQHIMVKEGDILNLSGIAYDPDGDSVDVGFSGFVNKEKTYIDYGQQGEHTVVVKFSDWGHSVKGNITISVENTNREPYFGKIENVELYEGQNLVMAVPAFDTDNDNLTITEGFLPDGAVFADGVLNYTPGYDAAHNDTDVVVYEVGFIVSDSSKMKNTASFNITVLNGNQFPAITGVKPWASSKAVAGKPITFGVKAEDGDGDMLTYKWKFGFLDTYDGGNEIARVFTSAGVKEVSVAVTDGKNTVEHTWIVEVGEE